MATNDGFVPYALGLTALEAKTAIETANDIATNGNVDLIENTTVPGGAPAAGHGKIWVKDDVPNSLMFTDDAATNKELIHNKGGQSIVDLNVQSHFDFTGLAAAPTNPPAGHGRLWATNATDSRLMFTDNGTDMNVITSGQDAGDIQTGVGALWMGSFSALAGPINCNGASGFSALNVTNTYGLQTSTSASTGVGVYGSASDPTGATKGLSGWVASPAGHAVNGIGNNAASYDFYAQGVGINYGPFTGSHDGLVDLDFSSDIGDIVVDVEVIARKGLSNTICKVAVSNTSYMPAVVGVNAITPRALGEYIIDDSGIQVGDVPSAMMELNETDYNNTRSLYNRTVFNAVGEGQINVCGENGDINIGDYIVTSNTAGKGMKQDDDIYHNYTVAKARESVVFDSPTQVKMISCIYLCG